MTHVENGERQIEEMNNKQADDLLLGIIGLMDYPDFALDLIDEIPMDQITGFEAWDGTEWKTTWQRL